MADSQTKLVIEIQTILRNLDRTLKGLSQVESQLKRITSLKVNTQNAASFDKAALATQRLQLQQQRLQIQSQQLVNAQEKVRQNTERLTLSRKQLEQASAQAAKSTGNDADAHVKAFKAIQRGLVDANNHVKFFRANEKLLAKAPQLDAHVNAFRSIEKSIGAADSHIRAFRAAEANLKRAPQLDAHVKAFRAIQKGVGDADAHVRAFRANEAALARAPQLDAHVRAFRAIEQAARDVNQRLGAFGNALRSIGQGLASVGATLTAAVTVPLLGLGAASVDAAVRLDSLKRGLTAIVGSSDEANRQLARLTQIAKLPGIGFEEAIQGSIRLQAVGFSAKESEKSLREFSNAIALTGGGRDELARVTVQLGQLAAKGKVLSQDLRPIIEAAPAVGRALLQAFGTVNAADIQELGLSSKEFLDILVDELGRLPRAAAGAKNSFENFRDEVFRAAATVGEALLPALVKLAETAGPIITAIANAFAGLPKPIQVIVIGFAALLAALGPILFITGQLTLGVGRLVVGFAELNALGILPTIANLRKLTAGTLGAAAAQRSLAAAQALAAGALGIVITLLAAAITVRAALSASEKDSTETIKEQTAALTDQINGLKQQSQFIKDLQGRVELTADEEERLLEIYNRLGPAAKERVSSIEDEEKRLKSLQVELQRIINLRNDERVQQAANLAATVAENVLRVDAEERTNDAIVKGISIRTKLIEELEKTSELTDNQRARVAQLAKEFGILNFQADNTTIAIALLREQNSDLIAQQDELRQGGKEVRDGLKEQIPILRQLAQQTGKTETELLLAAKGMGLFKGNIDKTIPSLEAYIAKTNEATSSTRRFRTQTDDLLKGGDEAREQQKQRRDRIQAAVDIAKEATTSFEGALKTLRAFIAAQPELREAIEKERQLQGKSFDEFLADALGQRAGKSESAIRNAREQLANAALDVAQAEKEQELAIEKAKNDASLRANETALRLRLRSYREYLETRALFTQIAIDIEAKSTTQALKNARDAELRLRQSAAKAGIPEAERVKRLAQATAEQEKAIKAETRLKELEAQRSAVVDDLRQSLADLSTQQQDDIRRLDVEFAQLTGRIEDALNTDTVEKFRVKLEDLTATQKFLDDEITKAAQRHDAERVEALKKDRTQNQSQIELIESIIRQEQATNKLAAAQQFIEQSRQKQVELEERIAFEVEFRGLKEEEAIKKRLAGEDAFRQRLLLTRDIIQEEIDLLNTQGVKPPQALLDFIRETNLAIKGLGELPFSEQFRLVEKEFNRLNDERLQQIADVERAVRNRTIAEAEGLIFIRRINGQYVADLEAQLALLKQIAAASGDENLQRQAQQAEETTKDANDELASFNQQLRSTSIDALRDGFTDFFKSLSDNTTSAKEKLLNLINSVVERIQDVIAENLSRQLIESLFGGKSTGEGIIARIKGIFGGGGSGSAGGIGAIAGGATEQAATTTTAATLETGAAAAATTLQAGATAAAATDTTAAAGFATAITTAATAFAAAVTAAGAAFAAAVTASSTAEGLSGGLSSFGGGGAGGGFAKGDIIPARPTGLKAIIAEGGHAEAVLTTDPRHVIRQARILSRFLKMTRGLGGRFPVPLAEGALITPREVEANMLSGLQRTSLANTNLSNLPLAAATGGGVDRLRLVLTDDRSVGDWLSSSEGERVIRGHLVKNRPLIQDLAGRRR